MMDFTKSCADCTESYFLPDIPKYRRCRKSPAKDHDGGSLCGVMRLPGGACGPNATLFQRKPSEPA